MVHEHVASYVIDPKFEHRAIARSDLEGLNIMQGIGGIAAAVHGAEKCADYMEVREQVGPNVDKKNATSSPTFTGIGWLTS
jgi:hypothetical protein